MPYRFLFCTVCGASLSFRRDRERNCIVCANCGVGMELTRNGPVARLDPATAAAATPRIVPTSPTMPGVVHVPPSRTATYAACRLLIAGAMIVAATLILVRLGVL